MKAEVRILFIFFLIFHFLKTNGYAQITLPKVFGDNMVLQRDIPIPVWGNATPGSHIVATLGTVTRLIKVNRQGKWMLYFPKFKAGGPYDLKVAYSGKPESSIKLKGLLIGDVWLASGQSNMEWQVQQAQDAPREVAKAGYPQIRFLIVQQNKALSPQKDILAGTWKICDTNTVKQFSAVAYYFARKIHKEQNVPIGIIQSTWGGTPIEPWTSREMLLTSPITRTKTLGDDTLTKHDFLKDSLDMIRLWDIVYHPQENADKITPLPEFKDTDWNGVEMPRLVKDFGIGKYEGIMWLRKKIELPPSFVGKDLVLNIGHPEMNYSLYFNGAEICRSIWNNDRKQFYTIPSSLVKHGENVVSLRIAMLWGGGGLNPPAEDIYITNGHLKISLAEKWLYKKDMEPPIPKMRNYQYHPALLFNAMINPLIPFGLKGFIWYQGEANDSAAYHYRKLFPMLISDWRQRWHQGDLPFLYVQLANFRKTDLLPAESEWAELREAQALTLSQPNTGMACTIDIGEVNSIHPLNKQEVGRRLALVAEKKAYRYDICASGPLYKKHVIKGNSVIINFTCTGPGLATRDSATLRGFTIAGNDKKFYWASARIEGDQVIVSSDKVEVPVAVRYAWADNPVCNLINKDGLPAVPFRTDEWRGITQR